MMIILGRLVIFTWALLIAYVGYLLIAGEVGVITVALEANRILDVTLNGIFTTLVVVSVFITFTLFIFVGVMNEGS